MKIFRQKYYTQWDNTDSLKRMKDSDILAENYKSGTLGDTAKKTALGAGFGAAVGGMIGGFAGLKKGGAGFNKGFKAGAKAGALVTGGVVGTSAAIQNSQKQKEVNFYNNRLDYAKRQASRREQTDWRNNMTQREGYTY